MTTFYWHDYETFGLDRKYDRPAQFAAIRTDEQFNPIGEPDLWYSRTADDYLPAPAACLLTGITPQTTRSKGMCEAEFAANIRSRMIEPGTISVGYNSLRFDDEVTRNLMWRNLYDAYEREYGDGRSRWDLYPFVLATWALRPDGIRWPRIKSSNPHRNGQISFRLENLTRENGLEHSHAHDALSDVEGTIALAGLIARTQPRLWQWALANRSKEAVRKALGSGRPCVWIDPSAGQRRGFIRVVLPVAVGETNASEVVVWDCREDPEVLVGMDPQTILRRSFNYVREVPAQNQNAADDEQRIEPERRIALCRLRVNAAPFVCDDIRVLSPEVCQRFRINIELVLANAEKLHAILGQITGPVMEALSSLDPFPTEDADGMLYAGFVSNADKEVMRRVHSLSPERLAQDIREGRIHFEDDRLTEMLFRMRARNYPETLSPEECNRWHDLCAARLQGRVENVLGFQDFSDAIDEEQQKLDELFDNGRIKEDVYDTRQGILNDLYAWAEYLGERIGIGQD